MTLTQADGTVVHRRLLPGGWQLWPQAVLRSAGMPFEWLLALADSDATAADPARLLVHPEFLSALTWQNPAAAGWALRAAAPGGARLTGYRRAVLVRYAQRYCAKNDSIGFFGPVAWAELDAGAETEINGTGAIRRAEVYLEHWVVAALAQRWGAEPTLAAHVPLRLNPALSRTGRLVRLPARPPIELSDAEAGILDEIAAGATSVTADAVPGLVARGVLCRGFRLPVSAHPELLLRTHLEQVPEHAVRVDFLARLDRVERAVDRLKQIWAQPREVRDALADLDAVLADVGGPPGRRPGTETGRTPVYLDCRRDTDVRIGVADVDAVSQPLALLLESARWLCVEVAGVAARRLDAHYDALARRGPVTLADLHFAAAELLTGADGSLDPVAEDFRLRWHEVLGSGDPVIDRQIPIEHAAPMVAALFGADGPAWAAARNHSPDLLLARTSEGPKWVLGELHVAMNTLESRFFHEMSDDPASLLAEAAQDFRDGRVVPCYPTDHGVDSRRYPPLATHVEGSYRYWSFTADDGPHPFATGSWPATGLLVRRIDGALCAGPADGSWQLPVLEFFGEFLSALVVNRFTLLTPAPRRGRVAIGDLVVARRSWQLVPEQLPPRVRGQRGYHTDAVVAVLRGLGVPRHFFVKVAFEPKPVYVDQQAPLTVANMARLWLAAAERLAEERIVDITEMLPGPDQLWLTDERGHYTSELRMVAVDPKTSGAAIATEAQE